MLAEQITLQHSIEVEESAKPRFTREYILKYAQIVMYPTNRAPRACVQMVNPNIKDIFQISHDFFEFFVCECV